MFTRRTLLSLGSIRAIVDYEPFKAIVVVDEAYIDFSETGGSAATLVVECEPLVHANAKQELWARGGGTHCSTPYAFIIHPHADLPPLIQILLNTKVPPHLYANGTPRVARFVSRRSAR